MMKLRKEIKEYVDSKEIQKYINHVTQPLSFLTSEIQFSPEISGFR